MTGSVPNVARVASVSPASVITLVSPSTSGERILGLKTNKLKAPIANPIMIIAVDRMLCFWMVPIPSKLNNIVLLRKMEKIFYFGEPMPNLYENQ